MARSASSTNRRRRNPTERIRYSHAAPIVARLRRPADPRGCHLSSQTARATTITIVSKDGTDPAEGFNDPAAPDRIPPPVAITARPWCPAAPRGPVRSRHLVGLLSSNVPITIAAAFNPGDLVDPLDLDDPANPLNCTATSAVLGTAGPTTLHGNFAKAPFTNTWYPQALANSLTGKDLSPDNDDIEALFNSSVGGTDVNNCLPDNPWYYGLDGNPPAGKIDFVTIALHELDMVWALCLLSIR